VFVGKRLRAVIEGNDFKINWTKVRLQHKNYSQEVTGLTVNQFPNVDRRFVVTIRSMLYVWDKYGLLSARVGYQKKRLEELKKLQPELSAQELEQNHFPCFDNVLRGKIDFLGMVRGKDDSLYLKYLDWYKKLSRRLDDESTCHSI